MREILFRGKRTDNGEWVYGYVNETTVCGASGSRIVTVIYKKPRKIYDDDWWEIDPSTVGQYTGLTDKYGIKIFEGDIIYRPLEEITPYYLVKPERYKIIFRNGSFVYANLSGDTYWSINDCEVGIDTEDYTIIGNIYDNKLDDFCSRGEKRESKEKDGEE